MKHLYKIVIVLTIVFSTSCKKYLDTTQTDFYSTDNYYNTEAQLQAALNANYSNLMTVQMYGQVQGFNFTSTVDEMLPNITLASDNRGVFYTNLTPTQAQLQTTWQYPYIGINLSNNLIDNINKPSMTEKNRGYIKGQALFLRAFYYFFLTARFGEVPLILHSPGIEDVNIAASSRIVIYQQIEADLKEAELLLADRTVATLGYNDLATITAVQALLANVYLYWASYPVKDVSKYDLAESYASKVINSGLHDLNPDYRQVFINLFQDKYDIKEDIFEIGSIGAAAGISTKNGNDIGNFVGITSTTYNGSLPNTSFTAVGWTWATKKLFDSYEVVPTSQLAFKSSLDTRRDWNCADFTYVASVINGVETRTITPLPATNNGWLFRCGKFRREYAPAEQRANGLYSPNWPLIRFAEVLLIRAEANILKASPDLATAKADIERVRKRAYGTMYGNIVKDITVVNGGSGYSATVPPVVTITGGGGSGATATAVVSTAGVVTGIRLRNRGTLTSGGPYFTSAPTVTIAAPANGTTATALATITNGSEHRLANGLDQAGLFQILKDERMREMCFEGIRRYDLTRWGNFFSDLQNFINYAGSNGAAATNPNGYQAIQSVQPKHEFLPKPTYELNLNKLLTQNPGY